MSNNTKFDLCINKEDLKCCVCLKNLVSLPLLQNSGVSHSLLAWNVTEK